MKWVLAGSAAISGTKIVDLSRVGGSEPAGFGEVAGNKSADVSPVRLSLSAGEGGEDLQRSVF